jgi:hypothetical protein
VRSLTVRRGSVHGPGIRIQYILDPVPPVDIPLLVEISDLQSLPSCRPQRCVRNTKPFLESSECVEFIRVDDADGGLVGRGHACETFPVCG